MLHDFPRVKFRTDLLKWWESNKREYPWRETRDPYQVLVAEVLLHRTRADQVLPVYFDFLEKYPNIFEIDQTSIEELTEVMKPLGLFWRIELIKKMAAELCSRFRGEIPSSREDLESLSGVSHYIATAVRCFAFGYSDALLDTNTVRITGRLLGLATTDGSRRSRKFREILEALIDHKFPREFNFGLIDLGALICRARSPLCDRCPLNDHCHYYRGGLK